MLGHSNPRRPGSQSPLGLAAMRPAMNLGVGRQLGWQLPVFGIAALILTWLVLSRSLAAFLASAAPQSALWFDSRQPAALVNLADQALTNAGAAQLKDVSSDQEKQPGDAELAGSNRVSQRIGKYIENLAHAFSRFESAGRNLSINRPVVPDNEAEVRSWAQTALAGTPLNSRALRILGQLAEADSDDQEAAKFMRAAEAITRHENYASFWLLRQSVVQHDYKSAVYYADVLLRTNADSSSYVVPFLAQISEDKAGAPFVKAVLADNPPWRRTFLTQAPQSVTDPRTTLDLLLALQNSPVPPTAEDLGPYISLLVSRKFYGLAYYSWLQFLPPERLRQAGPLYNGSFEAPPSGLPFDWKITPGAGVTIEIVPRPDRSDKYALMVDFQYGRVDYHSVSELVMLAPGGYSFRGEYTGRLVGPRGMKWRIVCANGNMVPDGESSMIMGSKDWQTVAFTFKVPDKDCPAQYVDLDLDARMASEQFISGSILFDDLQISRMASGAPAAGKPE
jgi:hypothetical protein